MEALACFSLSTSYSAFWKRFFPRPPPLWRRIPFHPKGGGRKRGNLFRAASAADSISSFWGWKEKRRVLTDLPRRSPPTCVALLYVAAVASVAAPPRCSNPHRKISDLKSTFLHPQEDLLPHHCVLFPCQAKGSSCGSFDLFVVQQHPIPPRNHKLLLCVRKAKWEPNISINTLHDAPLPHARPPL